MCTRRLPTMPTRRWSTAAASACVSVGLVLAGCAGNGPAAESSATPSSASATAAPSPPEVRDGMLTLASGVAVHYQCVGTGTPAILLEAGTDTAGTTSYGPGFIHPLAGAHQVCSYDRLGTGQSDPAPAHKRTIGDLCTLQHQVRDALHIGPTAALVGQSGGGNIVIWCAAQNPRTVAALVAIEAYHDNPKDLANEGMSWRDNHEHVDWVDAASKLDTMPLPIGTFPVLVISASHADPDGATNQMYWLRLSPTSRQVVVDGGHNLHQEAPQKVDNEIMIDLPKPER